MKKRLQILFPLLSIIGDVCIINLMLYVFCFDVTIKCYSSLWYMMFVLASFAWVILALSFRIYSMSRIKERKKKIQRILMAGFILFFLFIVGSSFGRFEIILTLKLFIPVFLSSFLIILWSLILDFLLHYFRKYGFNKKDVLIVGYNKYSDELRDYLQSNPWSGYYFKGFVHSKNLAEHNIVGTYDDLRDVVLKNNIDELFLNMKEIPAKHRSSIKLIASDLHLSLHLIPDVSDFISYKHHYQWFDLMPVITLRKGSFTNIFNRLLKRIIDLVFSIMVLLLFFSWISPFIIVFIKLSSKGPVFFKQKRTGFYNKSFTCLKFRTMIENVDADHVQASKDDKRLTKIGKILRQTSLDELPQFFNVIVGQMSVVGPRPHMLNHTEYYADIIPRYLHRHSIRPGITGLAQIRGYRGETKELSLMKTRVEYDIYYIENWSFWLDIKIIILTITNIFRGEKSAR